MSDLLRAAFKRDMAALTGHIRAGLRGDGFGETARRSLDELWRITMGEVDRMLEVAASRLEHRATSEQIDVDRGGLVRDGKTTQRVYAIGVLREEADWIRRCKSS